MMNKFTGTGVYIMLVLIWLSMPTYGFEFATASQMTSEGVLYMSLFVSSVLCATAGLLRK